MAELKRHQQRWKRFPWRKGNHVELLVDGNRFFPEMENAIDSAQKSVELEMYLFESGVVAGEFIHRLCNAAGRGVEVRLLLDGFGALKLLEGDRNRLLAAGVDLKFYNPLYFTKLMRNMTRDHRKLLIVDNRLAFVGGAGITDEFDPPLTPARRWRETVVLVKGPVVADWKALFEQAWADKPVQHMTLPIQVSKEAKGNMNGRVAVGSGRLFRGIYRVLIRRIRRSRQRVWICTAYFVPSRQLRKILRAAARKGLDVRLLLPGPETDHPRVRIAGRGFYTSLLKSGVRIFEYQGRVLHSKVVLCDKWVSVGSSNYDRWNLRWNLEANQEVEDEDFRQQAEAMFVQDFDDSREILREQWLGRPMKDRVAERFWGWVELWITRLGGRNWED